MKLLWLSLLFFPMTVQAMPAQSPTDLVKQGGFYKPDLLPIKPENLQQAVGAVNLLENCSSTILSSDGYVATNLHCLHLCFERNYYFNFFPQVTMTPVNGPDHSFSGMRYPEQIPTRLVCPQFAGNGMRIEKYDMDSPKVVWLGKGRQVHIPERVVDLTQAEFDSFSDLTEDVAILKFEPKSPLPCIPLASKDPDVDEMTWVLGYPEETTRTTGQKADAYRLSVSLGQVRKSITEDPVEQARAENVSADKRALYWQRESQIWDDQQLLLTSNDIFSGNSGGAVINSRGELVGISFAASKVSHDNYNAGSLMAYRTSHLKKRLIEFFGEKQASEIFNCPSNVASFERY